MALSVGASAPELPLGDLAAVMPLEALASGLPFEAIEALDAVFALPLPVIESEWPPMADEFVGLESAAVPTALANVTPERWLVMAREQGALQVSAQPLRQALGAIVLDEPLRLAEALAPRPSAPVPVSSATATAPALAPLATARAPRPAAYSESPPTTVANAPAEAASRQRVAVATVATVAVAGPNGLGSSTFPGEPAAANGAALPATVSTVATAANTLAQASHPVPAAPLSAPPTLEARWGAHMVLALRERVQVQIQQRVQHATIRLDPPHLGSLQVSVSHEAGRVEVHINATQADTARLLGQAGERLRQELAEQYPGQVSVSVSADGQGRQPSRQPLWHDTARPPAAAREDSHAGSTARTAQGSDVWVTV